MPTAALRGKGVGGRAKRAPSRTLRSGVFLLRTAGSTTFVVGSLAILVSLWGRTVSEPGPHPVPPSDTIRVIDDEGRTLVLREPPARIVSLVPAVTEILFSLGAGHRLAGRTRFGVHPEEAVSIPSVGDGVRPSVERVVQARPDLVVLFAGPDNRGVTAQLDRLGIATLALRHNSLADLERNILRLGRVTGCRATARALQAEIIMGLDALSAMTAPLPRRAVYYDVWSDPPITIGSGSYVTALLEIAGGRNIFDDLSQPSPRVSLEAIAVRDPDLILWPRSRSEGEVRPRPAARPGWPAVAAVRRGSVRPIDADLVHRLGPRIVEAARALALALHPSSRLRLEATHPIVAQVGTCHAG